MSRRAIENSLSFFNFKYLLRNFFHVFELGSFIHFPSNFELAEPPLKAKPYNFFF